MPLNQTLRMKIDKSIARPRLFFRRAERSVRLQIGMKSLQIMMHVAVIHVGVQVNAVMMDYLSSARVIMDGRDLSAKQVRTEVIFGK